MVFPKTSHDQLTYSRTNKNKVVRADALDVPKFKAEKKKNIERTNYVFVVVALIVSPYNLKPLCMGIKARWWLRALVCVGN